jgi:hypothetical protein
MPGARLPTEARICSECGEGFKGTVGDDFDCWPCERKSSYIYCIKVGDFIKIGYCQSVRTRLSTLRTSTPYECSVIRKRKFKKQSQAQYAEAMVHHVLRGHRVRGEWFHHNDATEKMTVYLFTLADLSTNFREIDVNAATYIQNTAAIIGAQP